MSDTGLSRSFTVSKWSERCPDLRDLCEITPNSLCRNADVALNHTKRDASGTPYKHRAGITGTEG